MIVLQRCNLHVSLFISYFLTQPNILYILNSNFVKHLISNSLFLNNIVFFFSRSTIDELNVIAEFVCHALDNNGKARAVVLDISKSLGFWACLQPRVALSDYLSMKPSLKIM